MDTRKEMAPMYKVTISLNRTVLVMTITALEATKIHIQELTGQNQEIMIMAMVHQVDGQSVVGKKKSGSNYF